MAELMKNRSNSERKGLFSNPSSTELKLGMGLVLSTKLKLGKAFEEQCDEEMGLPSWITNVNGGAKRTVADCIPRPAPSTIPEKPSGAQLTIFYGGTVYVYDDIPTDKGQAIMLMASSGNYSSYPHTKVQNGWVSQTKQKISVPVIKFLKGSGIEPQPSSTQLRTDDIAYKLLHRKYFVSVLPIMPAAYCRIIRYSNSEEAFPATFLGEAPTQGKCKGKMPIQDRRSRQSRASSTSIIIFMSNIAALEFISDII